MIQTNKIEELIKNIESSKAHLKTLEEDLKLEEEIEEMKSNLRAKMKLSSELTNEEIGDLCRTIELQSLLSALKVSGIMESQNTIFLPEAMNVSIAEVLCLLSKRISPKLG
ncbi:hypothetical protein C4544_07390 [candidate division WS5 bacterium]|uniref:Uncharacterized protein n=1 Tax=candidate division WS5 bacterium TaxID=2093353 RepID=A0A419D9N2_9BACT|nr:MAG: hypothetical protein C4544_07390 [candidate division WS5 bacterium]